MRLLAGPEPECEVNVIDVGADFEAERSDVNSLPSEAGVNWEDVLVVVFIPTRTTIT